jgi:hypothetical protein
VSEGRSERRGGIDWSGVGGIVFVAMLVAVFVLANDLDSHRSRDDFVDYYGDFRGSSKEWKELLANLAAILGAFSFVWFTRRLRDLVAPVDRGLAALVVGGGFLFVALFLAAVVAVAAEGTTIAYSDDFKPNIDTAILMSDLGLFFYTAAGVGAAVMTWAASLAALRSAPLPRWLAWAGFVVAVSALAIIALDGLPLLLFALWTLVVAVLMLRRGPTAAPS